MPEYSIKAAAAGVPAAKTIVRFGSGVVAAFIADAGSCMAFVARPSASVPFAVATAEADRQPPTSTTARAVAFVEAHRLAPDVRHLLDLVAAHFPNERPTLDVKQNPDDGSESLVVSIPAKLRAAAATERYFALLERWIDSSEAPARERICVKVLPSG